MSEQQDVGDDAQSKQSKGGDARAKKLGKSRKSEIAQKAAAARWEMPTATHDGPLTIGGIVLDCAVLQDETRVISQTKFMEALGIYYSGFLSKNRDSEDGTAEVPLYLPFKALKPFIERHLTPLQLEPVKYRTKTGNIAHGIRADTIPKVCEVWLDARDANALTDRQLMIAQKADILIRGFAHVGIIALVDEVTGYQYERQRAALEDLLSEILNDKLRRWVKTFPDTYFRELCRLRGVHYRPDMKLPQYFGHLTNDIIYKRLHPNLLEKLQELNPRQENGRRKSKNFQWLTDDVGDPMLQQHVGKACGLMLVADDWDSFVRMLNKAAPYPEKVLPLFKDLPQKD